MRLWAALLATLVLTACSTAPKPPDPATLEAAAEAAIKAIPAADPSKYRDVRDMKKWRNPYLMITRDGAELFDFNNDEIHHLKPEELIQALAKLPPSAWPYGRVVAAQENGVRAAGDDALIRKNRGIVAGTLESLQVLINWVPSS